MAGAFHEAVAPIAQLAPRLTASRAVGAGCEEARVAAIAD